MLKIFLFISVLMSFSTLAANKQEIQQSLIEIGLAKDQAEIVRQQSRDIDTKERMRYTQERLSAAELLLRNVLRNGPGNGGSRPPRLPGGRTVELFFSDSCASSLVGLLREDMDCSAFAGDRIWGIRIDGTCYDIHDMTGAEVCKNFPAVHNLRATEVYYSDSCVSSLVGMIDSNTTCATLSPFRAWGVKRAGVCSDIQDDTLQNACNKFK